MKNMIDCNEAEESQTSLELAKLLAGGKPEILTKDSQGSDELSASAKHELSDLVIEHDAQRRKYSLLGLGQGQLLSQTQHFSDDTAEEEETHSSQKENHYFSANSLKFGPDSLCPSNENAFTLSKSPNKNLGVFSRSCPPNPAIPALLSTAHNTYPDPVEESESLHRLSVSVDRPRGSSIEVARNVPSRPSQHPEEVLGSGMMYSNFGASSPERLDSLRRALSNNPPTPSCHYAESQSQESDKASQVSGMGSQDNEPQAQVVPQYDLTELRQLENEFYGDTQPQSQTTQSTQPAVASDDPNDAINDQTWANLTGIQVSPNRRHKYLASAKEGAALEAVRNDTFYDGLDSSAPTPADDGIFRQYPAGMPDPCDSEQETQLVETQLVESSQQEDSWVPPIQFPAGYGPAPEEEGAATQIAETQVVATQPIDDSSMDEDTPDSADYPPVLEPLPPARASIRVKSPINALEIVPDSEPPIPSPGNFQKRSLSVHVATPKRRVFDTRTMNHSAEAHLQPMKIGDDDDDDEKPLADLVISGRRKVPGVKGDQSASQMPPPLPQQSSKAEGKRRQVVATDKLDQETIEIVTRTRNSSKRKANTGRDVAVKNESSTKGKVKASKIKATEPPARRRSARPTRNQRSLAESEEGDDDDEIVRLKEEDVATESDDEAYITPGPSAAGESHHKRKRGVATSVPRKASKKELNQTPANRTPRYQSTTSLNAKHLVPLPLLRVLALYTDGYWYPGTVEHFQKPESYRIVFDDDSAEWAKTGTMRKLELRVGDEVMNSKTNKTGTVLEVKADTIVVSSSSDSTFNLPYRYLCIPCDKVEAQWGDREITRRMLTGSYDITNQSVLHDGADGFLRGCGIIITSNPNALGWNKEKNEIHASMIENGATLIEDWSDALQISGTYTYEKDKGRGKKGKSKDTGKRIPKSWTITKDQARWFEEPGQGTIQRVFVLADTVCQKPKYLTALALGVPCLSTNWMTDSLQNRNAKDWSRYLLPKGIDPPQNARLSQSVNLDWGTMPENLENIMDNPYAHKLFAGMSVLCVGDDYIPEQNEERIGVNHYEDLGLGALRTVTNRSKITSGVALIVLAMGASQVTAVANLRDASKDEHFDYVVFKDMKWNSKYPAPKAGTNYASWSWAKQCLIRGQMLPLS